MGEACSFDEILYFGVLVTLHHRAHALSLIDQYVFSKACHNRRIIRTEIIIDFEI